MPKTGEKQVCRDCQDTIEWDGRCWGHCGPTTPRHPAVPEGPAGGGRMPGKGGGEHTHAVGITARKGEVTYHLAVLMNGGAACPAPRSLAPSTA
jgi:hypothetical protein